MIFLKQKASKDRATQEAEEDIRRLFYVAFTRAKYRLYIPSMVGGKPAR